MISIMADNTEVSVDWVKFSDGASTCKINVPERLKDQPISNLTINVSPLCPVDEVLQRVILIDDALDSLAQINKLVPSDGAKLSLHLPYLPYGRADRLFEIGNPNPLDLFVLMMEYFEFDEIHVCDAHNPSAIPLGSRWINKPQLECFKGSLGFDYDRSKYDYVLAPDKGAVKKAQTIADWHGVPLLTAEKERCIKTGRILRVFFDANIPAGSRVLVCDDICDGGGTFVPLGEEIRAMGCAADIYFTHLIAAKGLDIFRGLYDHIYCYQTVGKHTTKCDVLNFNNGRV